MKFHLTMKSSNKKTGPMPVSTSSRDTCPRSCPFKGNGCYADSGPLRLHWNRVTDGSRGLNFADFLKAIESLPKGTLWRHNQAGDLPTLSSESSIISHYALLRLTGANNGRNGFTYTHHHVTGRDSIADLNRIAIRRANDHGFTVNLSANNLHHADELADTNAGPVVVVLPSDQVTNTETPKGRRVVVCPATKRDDITCATCKLCARQRTTIVGFPAHGGTSKHKANVIAMQTTRSF